VRVSELTVRRAVAGDAPALLELIREFCAVDQHEFDPGVVEPALAGLLAADTCGFVLIATQPHPVGYAVVTWGYSLESGGRDSLLDEFYVRERGRGIGSTLLAAALETARAGGASRMFLETEAHNGRVRSLYARHGFHIEDSIWMARPL
jgi:ribosomal protein S18 acetylase RimI-like enzyme